MPSFVVKGPQGEEYEVNAPEGATQEQAFEFFKREHSAGRLQAKKPLAPMGDRIAAGFKTGLAGVGNMADTAATLVRNVPGALKSYVTGELPQSFEANMEELNWRNKGRMMWANPDELELGTAGSVAAGFGGLPGMPLAPLSGVTTAKDFIDAGETGTRAGAAALTDAALNTAAAFVGPGAGSMVKAAALGAGANVAQGAALDAALNKIAQTKELKDRFQWDDVDRRITDAVTGGVFSAALADPKVMGRSKKDTSPKPADVLREKLAVEKAQTQQKAIEAPDLRLEHPIAAENRVAAINRKQPSADDYNNRDANVRAVEEEIAAMEAYQRSQQAEQDAIESQRLNDFLAKAQQTVIDDTPHGDRPAQFGMTDTGGRVDENGIPIRADLSMDAQNVQNPLQMNLWGDELQGRTGDGGLPLTRALDKMPPGPERDAAIAQLSGQQKPHRRGGKQSGAIDVESIAEGFQKVKTLLNGVTLKASGTGNGINVEAFSPSGKALGVLKSSASSWADPKPSDNLVTDWVSSTQPGLAKEMYSFISELGNDMQRSTTLLPDGKAMWDRFEQTGKSQGSIIPRKQRGALDFGPGNPKQKLIEEATREKLFADVPNADAVISQSLGQKDSKGGWLGPSINLESGGSMAAMKRQSPLVQGGVRIMQGWKNKAEDAIRNSVFPTEQALRRLSKQELTDLGEVFKLEMFERRAFSAKELADAGLSEKQLLAYQKQREMFRSALEAENAARAAQGKKPVTEQDFYLSSRWQGDFRVGFRDAQGKLVWYLAADSKKALDKQASQLLSQFPELTPDKMHVVKSTKRSGGDVSKVYNTMLDVLGEGDPAVAKIKAWAEAQMEIEGRQVKGQEKHFEAKANVRGFVGDRPGTNPTKEAIAMFQQQIQYAKNAHDWAAKQMAAQELKKVLTDESLAREQPNNMAYLREYFLDNLGANESNLTRAFEDWIRDTTGTSPNKIGQGIGAVKNYWVTSKLALNAGFMLSNVIQAGNILPHLAMMQKEFGGNPVAALTVGIPMGVAMATGHLGKTYLPQLEGMKFYNELAKTPGLTEFHARAMKYAEDNSVIARSIYDESPIESSFSLPARAAKAAGITITLPETFLRGVTFMTYVEQLKSSGKFKNDLDLFRVAEERTNISMGDYREGERAMIFNKMGNTGNMLNVLQTFAFNFYNQYATFGRHAVESKNPLPLFAMLATHGYMAGLMGVPGFAEADKAWEGIKSLLAEHYPETWAKVKNISIKEAALALPGGESITYGPLSTQSGVALTSRAAAPIPSEMIASPGAPLVDLGGQAFDVAKLLMDPTSKTKQAQAALSVAPAGLQGALETGPFRDVTSVPVGDKRVYGQTKKVGDLKGMYARTPEEESLRAKGLRSQKEAVTRELNWMAERKGVQAASVVRGLPNSIYRDLVDEDMDSVRDKIKLYAELSGNSFSSQQLTNQVLQRYLTPDGRMISKTMPLETVKAYKKLKDTLKEMGYDNAN